MPSNNNINIAERHPLPSAGEIFSRLPLSKPGMENVLAGRQQIRAVLDGKSDKRIIIVGPCSIHDPASAKKYARKLKILSEKVESHFLLVMRAYFEKPRTTIGWKGLIYDPDINGSYNIEKGIFTARELLLDIVEAGLPVATEMLDPIIAQYIADAVSWAAIGARTTESQTHRQLASGLSMPIGFKNATDGTLQTAVDAVSTAKSEHSFIGVLRNGKVGVFRTKGNPYGHVVLRGGASPNFATKHIASLKAALTKAGLRPNIIVDCSHANSNKQHKKQRVAFFDVIGQMMKGEKALVGLMLESHLKEGHQKIFPGDKPRPEVSITDACIGWEETEELILEAFSLFSKKP
jgi:3-deoxy-7-phosphoheptulonate synthase